MIKEINDKNIWNNLVARHGPKSGSFLQSFEWGEFQKSFGRKIWRLGNFQGDKLESTALIIKQDLSIGKSYLYCPRGPIFSQESTTSKELFEEILKIAKEKRAIFLRIEPPRECKIPDAKYQMQNTRSIQPRQTILLDFTKEESELLQKMHPKTRYNIRLAERHGVSVEKVDLSEENFEMFWKLLVDTSKRDKFSTHPKKYYKKMIETLGGSENDAHIALFVAKYKGKPLAAELVMFFGETATYLHGASSEEEHGVMAPYAIHWEIIKEVKKMGYKYYDFWGIDEKKWPGVTRFKRGFGGEEISYPETFDLPVQKLWYKIYCWARKVI